MLSDQYELRYLPLFHEELKERALYIAKDLQEPETAINLIDEVEEAIRKRISLNPEGYESISSKRDPGVKYYRIYVKEYIIYYAILEEDGKKIMEPRRFVHRLEDRDRKV